MQEQPTTPDELWLLSWIAANLPWIFAGLASGAVRFVLLWGMRSHTFRYAASESIVCCAIVSVLAPLAAAVGLDKNWAMFVGVVVGLAGAEVIRSAVADRLGDFIRSFTGRR